MLIRNNRIPIKEIILIGFLPGFLKKLILRFRGHSIGKNVSLGFGSVILGKNVIIKSNIQIGYFSIIRASNITIGQFTSIGSLVYIDTHEFVIGRDSRIREQVNIAGIKTPKSVLRIGDRCTVMQRTVLNPSFPITIGNDTGIGGNCCIFTHGSWLSVLEGFPVTFGPVTIGNNVWIPWNVFILPGITIGDNVIIGAGSVVNKSIPSNVVASGNPVKVKVRNFPVPLSPEQRNLSIKRIFEEFIAYLKNEDIKVNQTNLERSGSFILEITKNKFGGKIYYLEDEMLTKFNNIENDSLLVIDIGDYDYNKNKGVMVANLKTRERFGTTIIGEEFIKFISRYGLHLKRLD